MRIYRLYNGRKWPPHLNKDGLYVLGDPRFGNQKHHGENKVFVATEDEAISKIRSGHSIWVKSISSPVLVRENLYIDGVQFT